MKPKIDNGWDNILSPLFDADNYQSLRQFLLKEYAEHTIYPSKFDIFNAFKYTNFDEVRVVILGQDPYIKQDQAHGLSFSVQKGQAIPPSLRNIYKEIHNDIGCNIPAHGCLETWAKQGVLMLNTTLTVRAHSSNSHKGKGWEIFTDGVIAALNQQNRPIVYLLWGNQAIAKQNLINNPHHLILTAKHPSPLAGGAFFGCKHFSKTNDFLTSHGLKPIDWQID